MNPPQDNKNRLIITNILFWTGIFVWNSWLGFEFFIMFPIITSLTMFFSSISFCVFFYDKEIRERLKK